MIETLRLRLKELEGDNRELRKQIEVAYGLVHQAQVSGSKQQEDGPVEVSPEFK